MPVTSGRSSIRTPQGSLAASLKKRQEIWISVSDPRNNPEYIRNYQGKINVLSEADFAKWLRQEYSNNDLSVPAPLLNDSESDDLYGNIDNTIQPPGMPTWDKTNISFVMTDSGGAINTSINFPVSPSDPLDGTYSYHVYYEVGTTNDINSSATPPSSSGSSSPTGPTTKGQSSTKAPIQPSTSANSKSSGASGSHTITVSSNAGIAIGQTVTGKGIGKGATVTNVNGNTITLSVANTSAVSGTINFSEPIHIVTKTSTKIQASWKALPQAQYYNVTVTGANLLSTDGHSSRDYTQLKASGTGTVSYTTTNVHGTLTGVLSGGTYTFTLNQASSSGSYTQKHFSGSYTISVTATYPGKTTGTTSVGVTSATFTI